MTATLATQHPALDPAPVWSKHLQAQNDLQDTVHAPYAATRDRIIDALINSPLDADKNLAATMATCGDAVRFFVDPADSTVKQYLHRCKARCCPFCASARTNKIAAELEALMDSMTRPRTIILTVKSNTQPLKRQLQDLRGFLARLRRSKLWRTNVHGGAYVIEITRNCETALWHPHVHVVYEGAYIPQKQLQAEWHRITLHSEIVWIAEVSGTKSMAAELSKYLGKPARLDTWPNFALLEYIRAIRGARLLQTFGNCHGKTAADTDPNPEPSTERWSVSLARITYLAQHGNDTANRLLALVALRWKYLQPYIYHRVPQIEPDESKERKAARIMATLAGRAPPRAIDPKNPAEDPELAKQLASAFARFAIEKAEGIHDVVDLQQALKNW